MKEKRQVFYFDYSPEVIEFIMNSSILRESEKKLLNDFLNGEKVKDIANKYNCCNMTICRKRKIIYDKLACLVKYTPKCGDIETYYNENSIKAKSYISDNYKVVGINDSLYKVYLLTFPNNKVYIGITSQNEKNRWKKGDGYIDNTLMYNDILKYGWINIKTNILYKDLSHEEAREKEKELIIHYKSHLKKYGYNREF